MTFKLSKTGQDVRTATGTDILLDGDKKHFKGIFFENLTKTLVGAEGDFAAGTTVLDTFTHNLGYKPFYENNIYLDDGVTEIIADRNYYTESIDGGGAGASYYIFYVDVTTTLIRLIVERIDTGTPQNIPFGGWTISADTWIFADQTE